MLTLFRSQFARFWNHFRALKFGVHLEELNCPTPFNPLPYLLQVKSKTFGRIKLPYLLQVKSKTFGVHLEELNCPTPFLPTCGFSNQAKSLVMFSFPIPPVF